MSGGRASKRDLPLEALAYLVELNQGHLLNSGIEAARAQEIADGVGQAMADAFGGQIFYFPRNARSKVEVLHRQVVEKFNGTNQAELALHFRVALSTIYRILARHRARMATENTARAAN